MFIGVVSDTHNNLSNIERIVSLFNEKKIKLVIHTGDITNPMSLEKFSRLDSQFIGVYGNNDREEKGLHDMAKKNSFEFEEPPKVLKVSGKKIAIFHEPDLIDDFLSKNKDVDIILHGHTHRYRNEIKNNILFFNPGESAGMQKGKNAIGIVNLDTYEAKRIFF